jgi:hypothetical protein
MTKTVALLSEQPGWGRGLVASLPLSLRLAHGPVADLALVDGASGWTARALSAIAHGTRSVIVLEPTPADPTALADAADQRGAHVALASALADHPALDGLRDLLDASFAELVLDTSGSDSLDAQLFAQLRLLRALGLQDLRLSAIGRTPAAYLIEGEGLLDSIPRRLRLTGARGASVARTTLTAHAPTATARLLWQSGAEARPAQVSLTDPTGSHQLPAIHEGGHRHIVRNIIARGAGPVTTASVRDLRELCTLLTTLMPTP